MVGNRLKQLLETFNEANRVLDEFSATPAIEARMRAAGNRLYAQLERIVAHKGIVYLRRKSGAAERLVRLSPEEKRKLEGRLESIEIGGKAWQCVPPARTLAAYGSIYLERIHGRRPITGYLQRVVNDNPDFFEGLEHLGYEVKGDSLADILGSGYLSYPWTSGALPPELPSAISRLQLFKVNPPGDRMERVASALALARSLNYVSGMADAPKDFRKAISRDLRRESEYGINQIYQGHLEAILTRLNPAKEKLNEYGQKKALRTLMSPVEEKAFIESAIHFLEKQKVDTQLKSDLIAHLTQGIESLK